MARALLGDNRRQDWLGAASLVCGVLLTIGVQGGEGGLLIGPLVTALRALFGGGALAVPVGLIVLGAMWISGKEPPESPTFARGLVLLFLAGLGVVHLGLFPGTEFRGELLADRGGVIGALLAVVLRKTVGEIGSFVALGALACVALLDITNTSFSEVAHFLVSTVGSLTRVLGWSRGGRQGKPPWVQQKPAARPSAPPKPVSSAQRVESAERQPASGTTSARTRPRAKDGSKESDQLDLFPANDLLPPHFNAAVRALEKPLPAKLAETEVSPEEGIRLVESTLASFRIEAKVTQVKRGPVVTRYEVQPSPGIRVSRITSLADDLALALAAIDVRVEAPVPGKSVIGIEVPNQRVSLVRLRELIELEAFRNAKSKLTFALGKDIAGHPQFADLGRMPHLLIAGATNSGKSVCLNSIITSLLSRAEPEEVKLSLIDPKRVELTVYQDIPHLFHPVVVDAKEAVRALRGAIQEMDRRYRLFAERGVRNIESYNERLEEDEEPLYCIVIIIDELADLMMQAAAEFERLICRIAQLARATGIHLIIATQRPSVNVITGVIKANISSRIAFAVASQVDSRTILDMNGAERLIGSGDMLFYPIDAPKPLRIQGAFLSEEEVNRIAQVLADSHGRPSEYALDLEAIEGKEEVRAKGEERDDLFEEAAALVRRRQQASASMLQREFEIGYPRAGRIVDQLEAAGIIGPQEGSKPRQVLVGSLDADRVEVEEEELEEERPGARRDRPHVGGRNGG